MNNARNVSQSEAGSTIVRRLVLRHPLAALLLRPRVRLLPPAHLLLPLVIAPLVLVGVPHREPGHLRQVPQAAPDVMKKMQDDIRMLMDANAKLQAQLAARK